MNSEQGSPGRGPEASGPQSDTPDVEAAAQFIASEVGYGPTEGMYDQAREMVALLRPLIADEQVRVLRVALERITKLDDGFFNETKGRIALHLARAALTDTEEEPS